MKIRYLPEALTEYQATAAWYEEQSPGSGDDFVAAIERAETAIAARPAWLPGGWLPGGSRPEQGSRVAADRNRDRRAPLVTPSADPREPIPRQRDCPPVPIGRHPDRGHPDRAATRRCHPLPLPPAAATRCHPLPPAEITAGA
jgi:hypothetical protein